MPYHYPEADELADRLLPFRWQVVDREDASRLVMRWLHELGPELHEAVTDSLYRRRGNSDGA